MKNERFAMHEQWKARFRRASEREKQAVQARMDMAAQLDNVNELKRQLRRAENQ